MAKKKRKSTKKHKKSSFFSIILLICLVGGLAGGYFAGEHFAKNDKFELIGEEVIYRYVGESYQDEGAIAIAFGKKVKDEKIKTEDDIDMEKAGQYHIKYTVDNIRFRGVKRYRIIIVSEREENSLVEGEV